jgi:Arc/MetJ family transcription regulator
LETLSGASTIELDYLPIYIGLVIGMVSALALGHWLGRRHQASGDVSAKQWIGIVDGPIATAFRQTDLLSAEDRPTVQKMLRDYVESQSQLRNRAIEGELHEGLYRHSRESFERLWDAAVEATSNPRARDASAALLGTLEDIGAISARSSTAPYLHPPLAISMVLLLLSLVSSFLLGYQASTIRRKSWVHLGLFVAFLAVVTYLVVDLEYPRVGAIRIGDMQDFLRERHGTMEH